ncbi:hypothetical protein SAMN02910298_02266 [Pseudobutyrivibrio sp. YE44]|nr:hypothetical protein [Pseudobutyrivibrio sp. YE44]SDB45254.1 hypothetical protein SAMN02910298_02266 [Pseudobutyrivibrio sp. YE44]
MTLKERMEVIGMVNLINKHKDFAKRVGLEDRTIIKHVIIS